jgi:hypothetical protein
MTVQQLSMDKRLQFPAAIIAVSLMLIFPFIIHLIGDPEAGGHWLPMFYAPFAAAVLLNPVIVVVVGLGAPYLNHLLTGAPVLPIVFLLSTELIIFGLVSHQFYRRRPRFIVTAPLAYIFAKVTSSLLFVVLPLTILPVSPGEYFSSSFLNALPGMLVLLVINWLLVRGMERGA